MDHGVIEQVGSPQEIYGEPATSFVADFIGTMNFIPGSVEAQGAVRLGNTLLRCPTDGLATGAPVTVAIRPEDIDAEGIDSADGDNLVEVEITQMEFLGSFYRAALGGTAFGEQNVRADLSINLVRRKDIEQGSKLPMRFPSRYIRIYPGK
jgi:iron(III) transport system ATP-binding protein